MYGAILGDIIGSPFEFDRGDKTKQFDLFTKGCDFTDDSVMTIAVGEALLAELNAALNIDEKRKEPMEKRSMKDVLKAYQERADAQSQGEKGGTNEWNR